MKKINEMKRNEMMNELKNLEIKFDSKMKNEELINLLENSILESFNQESRKIEKKDISSKINFLESLNDSKMKESNFQSIHEKFMNESEISFLDSIEKIMIQDMKMKDYFDEKNNNFNDDSFNEKFEFIMIHRESRKIYYLFLFDKELNQEYFIMKNDSIMKNKIYLLKFNQFFNFKESKINYIKNDRKNQSKEIISKDSKEYQDKLKKYSMI
jgi:hypothetical protein